MRYRAFLSFAAIIFFVSAAAKGQGSPSQRSDLATDRVPLNSSGDCGGKFAHSPSAPEVSGSLENAPVEKRVGTTDADSLDAAPVEVNLDRDLKLLDQKRSALAQCVLTADPGDPAQSSEGACLGELLLKFEMRHNGDIVRDVPIGRLAGSSAFFYESGMTIDADGAPNAYHPDNSGLDDLANAGTPGRWEGLAKDPYGEPYIQGPDDPYPGYYVSETALADRSKPASDPGRYVDASRIPFVVLPGGMARELGARPGDFAVVFNLRNSKTSYAIFGDVGPFDRIGEGSMALADQLGIRSDARNGGARGGIVYLIFPGSGNGRPRTIDEINAEGQKLLLSWESAISGGACTAQRAPGAHTSEAAN